jgi:hypothetical protein
MRQFPTFFQPEDAEKSSSHISSGWNNLLNAIQIALTNLPF